MAETEILARLILAASGMHGADPAAVDTMVIDQTLGKAVTDPNSPVHGRDASEVATHLTGDTGPERRLDMMLRLGPYGDGFGVRPDGLTLQQLLAHPHGIDLGPLASRLPQPLKTRSGKVELLPRPIVDDLPRLRQAMSERADGLVLVGPCGICAPTTAGCTTCPPSPAAPTAAPCTSTPTTPSGWVSSTGRRSGSRAPGERVTAPAEITDGLRRGVVSLPHGWGHDRPGTRLSHAATDPGVNVNQLLDGSQLDPLSGNAVLNGVPVEVAALTSPL